MMKYIQSIAGGLLTGLMAYGAKTKIKGLTEKEREKFAREIVANITRKCKNKEEVSGATKEAVAVTEILDDYFEGIRNKETKSKGKGKKLREAEVIAEIAVKRYMYKEHIEYKEDNNEQD